MSRLRHKKSGGHVMAGALSGVHREEVDKPLPFKHDEEKKHGGRAHRMDGGSCKPKLGRKRGGHVKKKTDGTDDTPDRGMKFGTPVQDTPMSGTASGYGGKFAYGKGHVEDSLKRGGHAHHRADGGKINWIKKAIKHPGAEKRAAAKAGESTHEYMEQHKHDSGKSGARARLGLRLSAMNKHKD